MLKAKANAIMAGMEMYARTNGLMVEHNAFMADPASKTVSQEMRYRVSVNARSTAKEDSLVLAVYEYYEYFISIPDQTRLDNLVAINRQLQEYRFPSAASQQRAHDLRIAQNIARLRDSRYIVDSMAYVLRDRDWHRREQDRGYVHPAIFQAWDHHAPDSIEQLVMEWPRASKEGDHKIAYTRDEKYGEADRQLATAVSKYLARHFPKLASNVIRDISARYVEAKFEIVTTMEDMLETIRKGPGSCMSGKESKFDSDLDGVHPYEVYDPQYGWSMVRVMEEGRITGRVLINDNEYVRTYRMRFESDGVTPTAYSDTDERLNAWLRDNGYVKASSWRGNKLKYISANNNCGFVAPYIDGSARDVDVCGAYLEIVSTGDGEFCCDNTGGDADEREDREACEDCDSRMSADHTWHVYRDSSRCVCESCYQSNYTRVIGRRGDEYAVENSVAVEVDSVWYHDEWLSDNGIVQLENGEYAKEEDAVWIESASEYYPFESDDICYTKAGEHEMKDDCVALADGEWCLTADAWQCEHSGEWYETEIDSVTTKCGKIIHEDYADEYEMQAVANPDQQELPLE